MPEFFGRNRRRASPLAAVCSHAKCVLYVFYVNPDRDIGESL
jgi:hypothetical protein